MAGHSKWANIKHRKARQDASRGKIWTKVIREITVAAKGGPDPDDNPRLRLALDKANAANMPKDNIKRAIEKGTAIMVDCLTDNKNRTVSDVRHAFSKFGGNLGTDGSVSYLFNKLGIIHISKDFSEEDLLEVVLDAGAEDLVDEGDYFEVITSSTDLSNALEALKTNNIEHTNAELTLRAETSVSLDQEMSEKVLKIMDFMDELDDVQEVHTNAEFPENFEVKE